MGERRIEGQGPFHFPDNPGRGVKKVEKAGPARRPADEHVGHDKDRRTGKRIYKNEFGDTVELHTKNIGPEDPAGTEQ